MEKAREFQKNVYFCFIDYAKAFHCVDHHKLWKILTEIEIPDHLTCLLRNLYVGQEATVTTGHGTTDWFHIGKSNEKIEKTKITNARKETEAMATGSADIKKGILQTAPCT